MLNSSQKRSFFMNEIDKLKEETEKIKRDLWALSTKSHSGSSSTEIAQLESQIDLIETTLSNFNSRLTSVENKTSEPVKTIIFDMNSDDESLNYGFLNGMLPEQSITRNDLSTFKYFKFYIVSGESECVLKVDLPSADAQPYSINHTFAQNSRGFLTVFIEFSADLSTITFTDMVYLLYAGNSGTPATIVWYDATLSSHGHIKKIEAFS